MDDVSKMMAWAMVTYRAESHPLYIPGANYDRLVAKLANSIVEKERAQWKDRQMPISSAALEKRLGQYVESQVKHMHAQHRAMQSQNGRWVAMIALKTRVMMTRKSNVTTLRLRWKPRARA